MIGTLLGKVFGTKNEREMKRLWPIVEQVNSLETQMTGLSDEQLREKTGEFKKKLEAGSSLDNILPEAFAVVREVSRRKLKMSHFDVQIPGGIILHEGTIAEMKTGEGKTLVATLPVFLYSLEGKSGP